MKTKKILLISNDKISLKNKVISNEFNDTLNIIEAIHNHFNLFSSLFCLRPLIRSLSETLEVKST